MAAVSRALSFFEDSVGPEILITPREEVAKHFQCLAWHHLTPKSSVGRLYGETMNWEAMERAQHEPGWQSCHFFLQIASVALDLRDIT